MFRSAPSVRPEFDAWRWNQYWVELDSVVEFKRQVYQQALTELARLLNRAPFDGKWLRRTGYPVSTNRLRLRLSSRANNKC